MSAFREPNFREPADFPSFTDFQRTEVTNGYAVCAYCTDERTIICVLGKEFCCARCWTRFMKLKKAKKSRRKVAQRITEMLCDEYPDLALDFAVVLEEILEDPISSASDSED